MAKKRKPGLNIDVDGEQQDVDTLVVESSSDASKSATRDAYGISDFGAKTFSSGCTLLDCVLGGGWAYGRVSNLIGDKSCGKTLLAIEACANFARENKNCRIIYVETEAAFDTDYASSLGLPVDTVEFPNDDLDGKNPGLFTIEDIYEHVDKMVEESDGKTPVLYVVDSLDAVSDRVEMDRDIGAGSYAMGKQKKLSEFFRRLNGPMNRKNFTLMIVSQIRDAIGVTFGDKTKRSGGKALDFYATHCLWLANTGKIKKTRNKVERSVGIRVRATCKKNKIGNPYLQCDFPLLFGYGVEDVEAGLAWLVQVGRCDSLGITPEQAKKLIRALPKMDQEAYDKERANVTDAVKDSWKEISSSFAPVRSKY